MRLPHVLLIGRQARRRHATIPDSSGLLVNERGGRLLLGIKAGPQRKAVARTQDPAGGSELQVSTQVPWPGREEC